MGCDATRLSVYEVNQQDFLRHRVHHLWICCSPYSECLFQMSLNSMNEPSNQSKEELDQIFELSMHLIFIEIWYSSNNLSLMHWLFGTFLQGLHDDFCFCQVDRCCKSGCKLSLKMILRTSQLFKPKFRMQQIDQYSISFDILWWHKTLIQCVLQCKPFLT